MGSTFEKWVEEKDGKMEFLNKLSISSRFTIYSNLTGEYVLVPEEYNEICENLLKNKS